MKKIITLALLVVAISNTYAQDKVVTTNSEDGTKVEIKYYCSSVFYNADINFYRKEINATEWTKLNNQPIHWGDYTISKAVLEQDKEVRMLARVIDSVGNQQMEGLLQLLTLTKSFESAELSKYLGIQFTDSTVRNGATYTYRVMKITKSVEELIGISDPITTGKYTPPLPPQELSVSVKKRTVGITWKPESRRYYGVNVYRSSTKDTEWKLIVERPVIIGKTTDENGQRGYPEFFFKEQDLEQEVTYKYKLTVIDFFGQESPFSKVLIAPIKDVTPPLPPVASEASVNHKEMKVEFAWTYPVNEVPDLAGFNIYRSNQVNENFIKLNTSTLTTSTSIYANSVDEPQTYFYYVSAVDYAGNESPSNIVYALVPDIIPPAIPTGLSVVADTTSVTIKWQPNTETDLKGYLIYRVVDNDLKSQVLLNASTILETQFTDELAGNSKNSYHYYVISVDTAYNKSKPSAFASTFLPDFTPPIKPFIKRISVIENALLIQWLPAIDKDTEQFILYRSSKTTAEILIAILPANVTAYEDKTAAENTGYDYHLVSLDSAKNRSEKSNTYHGIWSTAIGKSVLDDMAISYDSASHRVNLSWTEEQDVKGYILYRKKEDSEFKPITGIIKASAYADDTIQKGSQYDYQLRSVGNTGIKGESKSITIIIK